MTMSDEFKEATNRGAQRREREPFAVSACYDRRIGRVVIALNTGIEIAFSPHCIQGMEKSSPADLSEIEITPSGFGVHFPKIGMDIYVPALLDGVLGSKNWMAARLGQKGGSVRSKAKTAASRANGKLGGRPRRQAANG